MPATSKIFNFQFGLDTAQRASPVDETEIPDSLLPHLRQVESVHIDASLTILEAGDDVLSQVRAY